MLLCFIHQNMSQTIHGLDNIFLPVYFHRAVHILSIEIQMSARLPQTGLGHMRGVDNIIAPLEMLIFPEILDCPADCRSFRVPVYQSGSGFFMNTEEVEFYP